VPSYDPNWPHRSPLPWLLPWGQWSGKAWPVDARARASTQDRSDRQVPSTLDSGRGPNRLEIVELRQYTLRRGQRDVLIDLFDREFVESQEAVGMKVIGQFRVINHPERFTWLRGFADMPTRARALEAFYDGPVWAQHCDAANATMIDSDDVLLLRPLHPHSGFALDTARPPPGSTKIPEGLIVATIYYPENGKRDEFAGLVESALVPALRRAGASILALLVTESSPNNFPRLPVREGEEVLVCFTAFVDEADYNRHLDAFAHTPHANDLLRELGALTRETETWKLRPTARSQCTASDAANRDPR
jgi:NIPSNAP